MRVNHWSLGVLLGMASAVGWAQTEHRLTADPTEPPVEAAAYVTVSAKGVQIYRCEASKEGAPAWVFVSPEATLYQDTKVGAAQAVGTHGAGPVWRWNDGSAVTGKVLAKRSSPETGAVPWLLLEAAAAPESAATGQLQRIAYVRRSETHGGAEPAASGCDAGHLKVEARVPYTAKYTFYRMPPR